MPRVKSILSTACLLAVVAGLAWSGREAGKRMARAGWFRGEAAEKKSAFALQASAARLAKTDDDPQAAANALRRLKFLTDGSFYLGNDWETLAEVRAILAGLSAAELAEIQAALEPGLLRSNSSPSFFLMREVLGAWVKLDPAAALTAAFQSPQMYGSQVFASWAMEDAAAALDWLESEGFPAALAERKDELRANALHFLLGRDFDRASAEFLKLPPGPADGRGRSAVISGWASSAVHDPALRERLVAFAKSTGRPEDHAAMNSSLLREWPQEDALGMLTYLQELREYQVTADIPADQRPAIDATAVGAAIFREYDRPALEWWMERYGERTEVPAALQDAMIGWQRKYPDKVNQWFTEQPASPQRDALQAVLVPSLVAAGKMDDAVQAIGQISDPGLRQSAIERLDFVWSKKDAAAAAAWRESLSP
jgi:hypothetical protein